MANLQWQCQGPIVIDKAAIKAKLDDIGFDIASSDLNSGFIFALANPRRKYALESLSILISWSPKRLDSFLVEVRSKEPRTSNKRPQSELLAEILKKTLPKMLVHPANQLGGGPYLN